MEPISIIAILAAGALVLFGLSKSAGASTTPSAADQATQQGASEIITAGVAGEQSTAQLKQQSSQLSSTAFKTTIGAGGAGVTAGTAAAAAGGAGAGVVAGAVTFGIGAVVGLAAVLWAKHEARIKGAKTENAAINLIVPGWIESIHGIIDAYNRGQVNDLTAAAELAQLKGLAYAAIQRYNHTPGVDWSGGGNQSAGLSGTKYWTVRCDKHCTIGCCLFNGAIGPATNNAIQMVQGKQVTNADGTQIPKGMKVPAMAPSPQYGFRGSSLFYLQLTR